MSCGLAACTLCLHEAFLLAYSASKLLQGTHVEEDLACWSRHDAWRAGLQCPGNRGCHSPYEGWLLSLARLSNYVSANIIAMY